MKIHKKLSSSYASAYPIEYFVKELHATNSGADYGKCIEDMVSKRKTTTVNIISRGTSGIVHSLLIYQYLTNKKSFKPTVNLLHLRKFSTDNHHTEDFIKMVDKGALNVIVDDFISSGRTLETILTEINLRRCGGVKTIDGLIVSNSTSVKQTVERVLSKTGMKLNHLYVREG